MAVFYHWRFQHQKLSQTHALLLIGLKWNGSLDQARSLVKQTLHKPEKEWLSLLTHSITSTDHTSFVVNTGRQIKTLREELAGI